VEHLTLVTVILMRISMPDRSSSRFCPVLVSPSANAFVCAKSMRESFSRGREGIVCAVPVGISVLINLLARSDDNVPRGLRANADMHTK
jgi:hypothetical protein